MEFRILGPLEVVGDTGEVEVRGAKLRAVLAILLVRVNEVVPADVLIDDLWAGRPPPSATATLQTYVYQLRKLVGSEVLRTRSTGYVVEIEPADLDALRFEHMVQRVTRATEASPEWARSQLTEALGWWRGSALADFEGLRWAQPEAARLESVRLGAVEGLIDARLALGEHTAIVPELERLVDLQPFRERLWAQLMLALYRSDRQADALRTYGRLRRHLGDELGIEPGRETALLEEAILLHKPELDWHARTSDLAHVPAGEPSDRDATEPARGDSTPPAIPERPPRRRSRAWRFAGCGVTGLAVAGFALAIWAWPEGSRHAATAPAGYRPTYRSSRCPEVIRRMDSTVRCGELTVPEDRHSPHSRMIRLGVYRFPARVERPAADPIVQVGGEFVLTEPPGDGELRRRSDSIYLAGRGFFGSQPRLTCPDISLAVTRSLSRPLRSAANRSDFVAAATSCRARWAARGVRLGAYSAEETAGDLRDLASALHIQRLNLLAGGHSTIDAQEVAGRYPDLIRSILLINVSPPDANRWNGAIAGAAGALDRYSEECASQLACKKRYSDVAGMLRARASANEQAMRRYSTADPHHPGHRVAVLLDGDRTMQLAMHALDDPAAMPLLAAAIADPRSAQASVDYGANFLILPDDASWGALLSRVCVDEIGTLSREGLSVESSAAPWVAYLAVDPLIDACEAWDVTPATTHTPGPGDTPTLILQGDLDPFTSREWTDLTARSFGGATVVRLPHLGDVAISSDRCVARLRSQFLDHPRRPIDPGSCSHQVAPLNFAGT